MEFSNSLGCWKMYFRYTNLSDHRLWWSEVTSFHVALAVSRLEWWDQMDALYNVLKTWPTWWSLLQLKIIRRGVTNFYKPCLIFVEMKTVDFLQLGEIWEFLFFVARCCGKTRRSIDSLEKSLVRKMYIILNLKVIRIFSHRKMLVVKLI